MKGKHIKIQGLKFIKILNIIQEITYTDVDLYITALSKRRAPNGPVSSGFILCFVSASRSYLTALSYKPTPNDSKYKA